jgi:hypothetical protein
MKLIRDIWKKFKSLFQKKKSKSTSKIYQEAIAIIDKGINKEEILENAKNSEGVNERNEILKTISAFENAKNIVKIIEEQTEISVDIRTNRKKKRLYEIYELELELGFLQEKLTQLNFEDSLITHAIYPDTSLIEKRVDSLFTLLEKNKIGDQIELSKISISAFDKSFELLENLLIQKSALSKFKSRENEKQRQEKIYENKIDKELNRLETLINQNDFIGSKSLILFKSKYKNKT